MSDDYKKGYRDGYRDGQEDAKKTNFPVWPTLPTIPPPKVDYSKCSVCGIQFDGPMGYVCQRLDCPSKMVLL